MGIIVGLLLLSSVSHSALGQAPAPEVIPLWPNGAPGSESRKNEPETNPHPWSIAHIYNPSLTVYAPSKELRNGTAVIIAPGGGHRELVVGEEGYKAAAYLQKLGITAFVLKYRLAREEGSGLSLQKDTPADGFRAVRYVRAHAAKYGLDPKRIGMLGFSAGGEVVSMVAFGPAPVVAKPDQVDLAEGQLDFALWVYPGPVGLPTEVPKTAPPAFLLVAQDDGSSRFLLDLATKYKAAEAPFELHILSGGGHGFNMGDRSKLATVNTWPQRMTDWFGDRGLLKKSD